MTEVLRDALFHLLGDPSYERALAARLATRYRPPTDAQLAAQARDFPALEREQAARLAALFAHVPAAPNTTP